MVCGQVQGRSPATDVAPPAENRGLRHNLPLGGYADERSKARIPPSSDTTGAEQRVRKKRPRGGGSGMREEANALC